MLNRRQFLQLSAAAAISAGMPVSCFSQTAPTSQPLPLARHLPRWRGFNLLEKFDPAHNAPYRESDFALMAQWGFNFVRLPMSYWCWSDPADPLRMHEPVLKEIDQAVAWGKRYGIHVNLNLHRIPGYCVNPPKEPTSLWVHPETLEAAAYQWSQLADRYTSIPAADLSFDLINEPADIHPAVYAAVVGRLVGAIRQVDPHRLIIADGLKWGTAPVPDLLPLGIAQSTRGYSPIQLTHYRADWMDGSTIWPLPTWPLKITDQNGKTELIDKEKLRHQQIIPWLELGKAGVGIHVGEWGAYRYTPHNVVLAWMTDSLDLWRDAGWGWSLWNFRGTFGVLDSLRADALYENFQGHKLDRPMLELLRNG